MLRRLNYPFVALFFVWLGMHILLWRHFGIRMLFDSQGYVEAAHFFVNFGSLQDAHHIFYFIPIVSMAIFHWLFPNSLIPFLLFQVGLSGIALAAIVAAGSNLGGNRRTGVFAGLFFVLWWDNLQWNTTVMTESIFCSLTCILVWWITRFRSGWRDYLVLFFLTALIFFSRPTGIVIVVGVIAFLVRANWIDIMRYKVASVFFFSVLFSFFLVCATLMFKYWDFTEQYTKGNVITYVDSVVGTDLYSPSLRLDTAHLRLPPDHYTPIVKIAYFAIMNPVHFLQSASLKIWYLMSGLRPYYSTLHNIILAIWMSLVYVCAFVGLRNMLNRKLFAFIVTVISVNASLIAISSADWDNRFYIPMEPAIVVAAGFGGNKLMNDLGDLKTLKPI